MTKIIIQESLDCFYPEDLVTVHTALSVGPQSYSVRFELYNMADGDREFTGIVNIDSDDLCTWTEINLIRN